MSVVRPPLDVQHQGQFWPWGATRKTYRSDFKLISPSALRAFRPPIDSVGTPPEDTGLPPFYPVFTSRGSKGPNGGPPVNKQGLLMLILLACTLLYVSISHVPHLITAAGLCAAPGTPLLFQTGLPLFLGPPLFQTGLLHLRTSVGTSGGSPIEAAFMLLPRCAPVYAF